MRRIVSTVVILVVFAIGVLVGNLAYPKPYANCEVVSAYGYGNNPPSKLTLDCK